MVRLATIDDVRAIQHLNDIFYFWHKDAIIECLDRIFVFEQNNEIVGYIYYNSKFNSILSLIVDKKHRRQGIAKKLFNVSVMTLRIKNLNIKATYKPINSISFWKSIGFIETGKTYETKKHSLLKQMLWQI